MAFFTKSFTVLAVIMAYAHDVLVASDDEMATLCFDELTLFPYINTCFFKPEKSDASQCKPLDHLFDGIDCTGPPDIKFQPTKILVAESYTCYLFKSADCSGDDEQFKGRSAIYEVTTDYWGLRCDQSS